MAVDTETLKQPNQSNVSISNKFIPKLKEHKELIAALFSGFLILLTWAMGDYISETLWVTLHLIAFVIGGYAKAKEGITETITNKELNVEMLMIFAAIGSAAIGYWTEGAILIFIFALSGALETYTMNRSNKEISSLMDLQPEEALLVKGTLEKVVPVTQLSINDTILVLAGERIPADGQIIKGATSIDESAITGESIPVSKSGSHDVYAGTVALDGTITVKITTRPNETLFQKIIQLVQSAQDEKSPSQLFIEKFEGTYVKVVLAVVAIMMFLPYFLFGWTLSESIYRAMILLVVASPCALVASIMPATLSAISNSAKSGVLFKGGVHIESLSNIKAIAFDKTGTLTNGKPIVTDAYFHPDFDKNETRAIVGAIEHESTHPLAQAITAYSEEQFNDMRKIEVIDMKNVSGNGVTAFIDNNQWDIGKPDFVGKENAAVFYDGISEKLAVQGKTVVFAKRNDQIVAVFALKDTVRKDTKKAIKLLKKHGVPTFMLTGDNEITARALADEAGIDHYIANCLPEEKVQHVKDLKNKYGNVAMVGDGINDAPALATANIGIAMGEGTDVALETADVVLMKNDLSKITNAIRLSGRMNKIVKQNIIFSLSVILILIFSNFIQVLDLPLGVIGHEGSTILVILNGLRLLK
ncbi:heavy metal translocating P-type ATPase [Virgibacillus profundi]|uniref:Heavy metal translocating P-type ATPase n=1 Tax=Virgibacillus profundi TaxID=2024555 RepID=A0A2A2I953_9BACI|nr:heavy metal translocating P-type ATPase [Virgibacillus profundi]PAV28102.1 heavy metal translocating P-type ATPase [Virgibacillus profundi]PXY52407.1 heavy metal translocating P-type ATPase [Virgibacillus profundi]